MNPENQQASKQMQNLGVQSEIISQQARNNGTNKQIEDISKENIASKQEQQPPNILVRKQTGKKQQGQKQSKKQIVLPKKAKTMNINFNDFLPQFLILLNQQKNKSIIRIGKNYQANVPKRCHFNYLYRPLGHLKIWSAGEVPSSVFKKFKEKFGENRTEEDICLLLYQYQCDWEQLGNYINEYKAELRKLYLQKDRTKS